MPAFSPILRLLPAVLAALLACAPAWADKDNHGGGKHGDKHERKAEKHERKDYKHQHKADKHERKHERHEHVRVEQGRYFSDDHRHNVRYYYSSHRDARSCPPGLARKHNGCMPPGQAKKWRVGERAPAGYMVLPQPMLIQLHLPPPPTATCGSAATSC